MGDPAGIGPEIIVKTLLDDEIAEMAEFVTYGSPSVMEEAKRRYAPTLENLQIVETSDFSFSNVEPGKLNAACGKIAYDAVVTATQDTLAGKRDAIVTAPINKAAVNEAGIAFTGHTELVASLCSARSFAMMQSAGDFRVAFVTTHVPLKNVFSHITIERIMEVTMLLREVVEWEEGRSAKLAVAALNPHAGEDGHMGDEERLIIEPALEMLRESGFSIDGPFPPDTLFIEAIRSKYDGILSMYHDQGHIPFKMLAFDRGVNSTLGLPIIRTSVDHGTAFEIAWKDEANPGSLREAIKVAIRRAEGKFSKK